jgi:thiosulfate dehydrogenase [quinone] large subunit
MQYYLQEAPFSRFLFANTKMSWLWLIVRVYVGYEWLIAGIAKYNNPLWNGVDAGGALTGFMNNALTKTGGAHPDVQGWYAAFLKTVVLPHANLWSHVVTYGEILVGVALIVGLFTGIAAFFGLFMNLNFLLAGAVSVNPILFVLSLLLVLAWRIAGYIGLDKFALKLLGTPWQGGTMFNKPQS